MAAPEFGHIQLNGKPYRVRLGSRRKSDIVDFSPRASTAGGSVVHSELGLYQSQLQTSWQHGFGFPWSEDAQGYLRTYGNIDTRHAGIAMMFTALETSLPSTDNVRRDGFTGWDGAEWSWGPQGLHRFDGEVWQQEHGAISPIFIGNDTESNGIARAKSAAAASLTFPITIANAADALLIVTIQLKTNVTVSSVTCGGAAMTVIGTVGTAPKLLMYKLVDPPRGRKSIVITLSASTAIIATGIPIFNVDQSTPTGTVQTATGTATSVSTAVTSEANDLVIDAVAINGQETITKGAGQTQKVQVPLASSMQSGVSTEAGGASVDMSWTWSSSLLYCHLAVNINNATHTRVNWALGLGSYMFYCPSNGRIRKVGRDGVHSDAGAGTNSTNYRLLIAHAGYVYALKGTNTVYYASEDDLSDLEGAPADDTNEIYIGANDVRVVGAIRAFSRLFFAREDGLWELGADRIARQVLDYTNERSSWNFRSMAEYKGFLIFAIRDQLFQWNGTRATPMTPPRISDTFPYLTYGRFSNFVAVGGYLYMTARTNEAQYTESLLCWDGVSWHKLLDIVVSGVAVLTGGAWLTTAMGYDTDNERLWIGRAEAGTVKTLFIRFQEQSVFPYANFPTTGSHGIIFSRMDAGYRRVIKSSPSLLIEASNLTATRTLAVYYSIDGGAYVLWSTVTSNGVTELTMPNSLNSIEYNYLLVDVRFVTADSAQSPILESLTYRFLMRPDEAYGYSYDILLGTKVVFDGREDSRTAQTMDADLETARASKSPVEFIDHFGRSHYAFVSSLNTYDLEEHLSGLDDYANIEQVARINLVLVG